MRLSALLISLFMIIEAKADVVGCHAGQPSHAQCMKTVHDNYITRLNDGYNVVGDESATRLLHAARDARSAEKGECDKTCIS